MKSKGRNLQVRRWQETGGRVPAELTRYNPEGQDLFRFFAGLKNKQWGGLLVKMEV